MKLYRKKRSSFWWATFRVNGVRYRQSTKEKLKTPAASAAANLLKDVEEGRDPKPKKKGRLTLAAYSKDFLDLVESIRIFKTRQYYKSGWRLLEQTKVQLIANGNHIAFASLIMDAISPRIINLLRFPGSPSNTNCALKTLRRMLHLAYESGSIAKVPKVTLVHEHSRHGRLLDAEAERLLLPHCTEMLAHVIILMRDTGMRNERELLCMRVEWIDWNKRTIYVPDSKTPDGERHIPMSNRAIDILRQRSGERREGWIFPSKRSKSGHALSVGKAFRIAREAAKLPADLVLYCGRHDFGTVVLQRTGNLAAVMRSMGHRDARTAMKYQHPDLEQVRMAINQPDGAIVQRMKQ